MTGSRLIIRKRKVPSFYNTTNETGDDLAEYIAKASDQEQRVFAFFYEHTGKLFTPEQIHAKVMPEAPLTSARRAITNLTTKGLITKSDKKGLGNYGRPVHYWYRQDRH